MVIERALEKLRQSGAAKAGGVPYPANPAPALPVAAPERALAPERPVKPVRAPHAAPAHVRVSFPSVDYSRAAALAHRIMLPDTEVSHNERVAASYRIIRTRLLHTIRTNNLRSLAVTSPGPGEGKSVTSMNIAVSLARDPTCSVFLLDLDMRNPSLCRYLGLQPPTELISYFAGSVDASSVLFSIGMPNLAIAGSVTSTDQASELLGSGRLEDLMDYIGSITQNPIILLDLPPVLVTDEALLIAPRVDATLMVVAEGKTRRDSLMRAQSVLAEFPSAGVVLNCSTEAVGKGGYYYDYQ
jgi:capsular exopolysaccharide synthesis family protein